MCLLVSAPSDCYEVMKAHSVMQLRTKDTGATGNCSVMTCRTGNGRNLFILFAISPFKI